LEHFGIFGDSGVIEVKSLAAISGADTLRVCWDVFCPAATPVATTHAHATPEKMNERIVMIQ
jgi:hypothetical protein